MADAPSSDVLKTPVRPTADVLVRHLPHESILLDMRTEKYLGLDAVGSRMWQLMEANAAPEAIIPALLDEYDTDEATLRADLATFVGRLLELGLVERRA